MIEVDLKIFLMSGQFGPINLMMTRQKITDILGWPEAWLPSGDKLNADLWHYEWIEFFFDSENRLSLIHCDHIDALIENETFIFNTWILNPQLNLADAEAALIHEQILFERVDDKKFELSSLILQSGVKLVFEPDEELPPGRYLSAFSCKNYLLNRA